MPSKLKGFASDPQSASTASSWIHPCAHVYELRISAQMESKAANSSIRYDKMYLLWIEKHIKIYVSKSDLLVKLTKGAKTIVATSVICDKLAGKISRSIATRLRHISEIKITDLGEVTTKEEILTAICKALHCGNDDDKVKVTWLWATRDGRPMTTTTVRVMDS